MMNKAVEKSFIMSSLRYDEWLSSILNTDSYWLVLDWTDSNAEAEEGHASLSQVMEKSCFVQSKISIRESKLSEFLHNSSFQRVECAVQFEHSAPKTIPLMTDHNCRLAEPSDQTSVGNIAAHAFVNSRFFTDPKIDKKAAEKVKREWAENYFRGKRGDALVVYEEQGTIHGFLQLLLKDSQMTIDLIAVLPNQSGKGIASKMISYAADQFTPESMMVGTQLINTPSIRLYEKMGFRYCNANYIYHYHNEVL